MIIEYTYLDNDILLDNYKYWFIYDEATKLCIELPQQCSGTMHLRIGVKLVICDSLKECNDYINNNNIILDQNLV